LKQIYTKIYILKGYYPYNTLFFYNLLPNKIPFFIFTVESMGSLSNLFHW